MQSRQKKVLLVFLFGFLLGGLLVNQLVGNQNPSHDSAHQVTQPGEEYHVHADFLVYINDEKLNLSTDEYMTTGEQTLHEHAHLHDGNGEVKHIHERNISFAEFLSSLNIILDTDCITIDDVLYCSDENNVLALYVNYEPYNQPLAEYIPVDDDSILLYFGTYNPEKITDYMNEVKDDACYYSGTCPERGIAPPESCGLTCEL